MATLELTSEEVKELLEIIERQYLSIRIEIANTDDREFRRNLKLREAFMKSIIDRLKQLTT
ncbi:MAG: hypothetical protein ABSB79_14015 [Syntrophales bacterium]|jgi:hypothetical protein